MSGVLVATAINPRIRKIGIKITAVTAIGTGHVKIMVKRYLHQVFLLPDAPSKNVILDMLITPLKH